MALNVFQDPMNAEAGLVLLNVALMDQFIMEELGPMLQSIQALKIAAPQIPDARNTA